MLYRKKPAHVIASQWFKPGDHPRVECVQYKYEGAQAHFVVTPNGNHRVAPGDWIVTNTRGEHSVCAPDVFEATYEVVGA